MASETDLGALLVAAQGALDVATVTVRNVVDGGSSRSIVVRAVAEPQRGEPYPVVIKAPVGGTESFARERAALSLIRDHELPGAVALLGVSDDPPLLVLEDLGDGPSVADLLLADDPAAAETALVDWAVTVGTLQGASSALGPEFCARTAGSPDWLAEWLRDTAERLVTLLDPLGVSPGPAALGELRTLAATVGPAAGTVAGLVPGDSCPDNALYSAGGLTLIDFEAAAHRPVAWEAAYLTVPWPTCWCCWALPDRVTTRAVGAWRESVTSLMPAANWDGFDDELARSTVAWSLVSLGFMLPHALPEPDTRPAPADRPRPSARTAVLHRLGTAAAYPTPVLPALRDLAAAVHAACLDRWGTSTLQLAPAFRAHGSDGPAHRS